MLMFSSTHDHVMTDIYVLYFSSCIIIIKFYYFNIPHYSCYNLKACRHQVATYRHTGEMPCEDGLVGRRFYPGGGDNLLGYSLWGENLYLGYSLPWRKFPGGGSTL